MPLLKKKSFLESKMDPSPNLFILMMQVRTKMMDVWHLASYPIQNKLKVTVQNRKNFFGFFSQQNPNRAPPLTPSCLRRLIAVLHQKNIKNKENFFNLFS